MNYVRYKIQLSGIFCSLFQRSIDTQVVPLLWKTAVVYPLPKVSHPSSSKDYRPIAFTSILVKSLKRIIKTYIMNSCRHALDPLQFAYRFGRGTDDAIVVHLNYLYTHLVLHVYLSVCVLSSAPVTQFLPSLAN